MERKPYRGTDARAGRTASPQVMPKAAHARPQRPIGSRSYASNARSAQGTQPQNRTRPDYGTQQSPRRSSTPPPRRPRMPKKKDPLARILPIGIAALLIFLAYYVLSAWIISGSISSSFAKNIYIDGIDFSVYTREEGAALIEERNSARLNQVHTLTLGDRQWSFTAQDFGAHFNDENVIDRAWNLGHVGNIFDRKKAIQSLKEHPIFLYTSFEYDESLVDAYVEKIYNDVFIEPLNATIVLDLDKPYLTEESRRGQELDIETARAQIISIIETGEGASELPMLLLEPDVSTQDALGSLELIVDYSTDTSMRNYDSRFNVRKALSVFNIEVHPGETIDFNEIVGPRTKERGWKPATEYDGSTTRQGYGGGTCQASSTLYGAMMLAGMTILDRSPHGMTVAYVDPSIDAAVTDSYKNFVFRNDTDSSIFIRTEVTKERAYVRVYGKRPPYRYELLSEIVAQGHSETRKEYVPDMDAKYVYYSDETKLYKEGHSACSSNSYLIAYDWDTGEEVSRVQISHDEYSAGTDIYWRGIHPRGGGQDTVLDTNQLVADFTGEL